MQTIRNQLKYPIVLQLPMFIKMGIKSFRDSIFMRLQKEQQIDNKQKITYILPENAFKAVKPYFGTQIMFECSSFKNRDCIMWLLINETR